MANEISFPLYAHEKSDWSMFLVIDREGTSRIEPFDFENNGYLFWDAQERGVRLRIERGKLTNREEVENEISLREAFARYSQALGVMVDTTGALPEVWARLQANVKPPSLLTRMVGHTFGVGCLLIILTGVVVVLIGLGRAIFAH